MVKVFRTMSYSPEEKKSFIFNEMMVLHGLAKLRSLWNTPSAQGCYSKMLPLARGCYNEMIPPAQGCYSLMIPSAQGCYNGMIVRSRAKPRPAQGCL
jgi:hypothetical protein